MFGTNKRIGKSYFKNCKDDELLVSSRFFTLQGEGPYRGEPAYFIRLSKCNLACSFCDTSFEHGEYQSFDSILKESDEVIADFFQQRSLDIPDWASGTHKKMVLVITGGEPSLQTNLSNFLKVAAAYFSKIQIESNGSTLISSLPESVTLVVSPKCLEKNNIPIRYLQPLKKVLARADCLKFVLCAPEHESFQAYSEIPGWAHKWAERSNRPLFISPMNHYLNHKFIEPYSTIDIRSSNEKVSFWEPNLLDLKQNQRNHEYAAEYCMKYGYILNLQLHLFASLP